MFFLFFFLPYWHFKNEKKAASERPTACSPTAARFDGYTFIAPEIVDLRAAFAPFFVDFGSVYDDFKKTDFQKQDNLAEWRERFCKKADLKDVEEIVYSASPVALEMLAGAVRSEGATNPMGSLEGNEFAQILRYNHCEEAVDYLLFARRCEPFANWKTDEWESAQPDAESMQNLIESAKAHFSGCKSHFFRLRYAFQAIRLAHYQKNWAQTRQLFDEMMPIIDRRRPSVVYWWAVGHQAGALLREKKWAEAAYRYALIFRNCPSKRRQAFESFYVPDDAEWQKALRFCQNDAETATLYALRAGAQHATVDDLEKIYALDPKHPSLELLLVSDVQQLEKTFLTTSATEKKYGRPKSILQKDRAAEHLFELQKLVKKVWQEKKAARPKLWRMMDGYLELLAGDFYSAKREFEVAETWSDNDPKIEARLAKQLEIWQLLVQICSIDARKANAEDEIFRIKGFDAFDDLPDFEPFLRDRLSVSYAEAGRPGKSVLQAYGWRGLRVNPTMAELDDLLTASSDTVFSRMEDKMLLDSLGDGLFEEFLDLKATLFLANGQPEAAFETLRKIPPSKRDRRKFYVFKEQFTDRVHGPISDSLFLNRHDLVKKLLDFERLARAKQADGARFYYLLGLAHYNMTFFGAGWAAADNFRSGSTWTQMGRQNGSTFPLARSPHGNRENLDCSAARDFFHRAMSLSRDPELAAKAAFMASKCELNAWYFSSECRYRPGSRQIPNVPESRRTYFDILKKSYSKTAFYQQAQSECKWFRAYALR